jgi:membrane-bound ClpP family serine protease
MSTIEISTRLAKTIDRYMASMSDEAIGNAREQMCECLVTALDSPCGELWECAELEAMSTRELMAVYAGTYGAENLRNDIVVEYNRQYPN